MESFLQNVAGYYNDKLAIFGPTPKGVDWRDEETQNLRFAELTKIMIPEKNSSITDLGCGYGAYFRYLRSNGFTGKYEGVDVSEKMIREARQICADDKQCQFAIGDRPSQKADYICASGIFNVKLECDTPTWDHHVRNVIDLMAENAIKGIAFNCLTEYSDIDRLQSYLYYASPGTIMDYCARKHSRWIELAHDYGLFEFTVRMRFDRSQPHRILTSRHDGF